MCEYCGCQALESIDALTREHERVLGLIGDVRTARMAGDVARQAELARQIAVVLAPHTVVEEQGLFPALASDFPDQIALLRAEHRLIDAPLAEAASAAAAGAAAPADPAWPDRLARALALLREHIFKEQDGVFPAALANLSASDWDAIDAIRGRSTPRSFALYRVTGNQGGGGHAIHRGAAARTGRGQAAGPDPGGKRRREPCG